MTQAPPDDGFGRAVRLASDRMSREGDDCPSPDELSAFADGALSGDEESAVVLHLSACARCQEIVSAVVRMSAAVDVPEAPRRGPVGELVAFPAPAARRMWRWVAPVAAATAAVLAWVVVSPVEPRRSPAVVAESPVARNESSNVAGVPGPLVGAAEVRRSPSPPESSGDSTVASVPDAAGAPDNEESTRQAASVKLRTAAERPQLSDAMAKQRSLEDAPPAAPSPAAPSSPAPAPAGVAPLPPGLGVESAENRVAPLLESRGRPAADESAGRGAAVAPSAGRRWRVAQGAFEESGDEGRTWRSFALPAGAQVTVAESAAPDVWWLAGPAGLVLRIEGGRVFEAARPSSSDITELRAASANGAIVGTSDGSRYETRDEGRTWRPLPSRE